MSRRTELPKEDELFTAARAGDALRVAQLLRRGSADANARNAMGDTPVVVACQGGHAHVVDTLLRAGADPNASFQYGAAPLAIAVERSDARIVGALLTAGARVDATNSWGATVLHTAASNGVIEIIELLLRAGADMDVRDKTGATPLQEAVKRGRTDVASVLHAHHEMLKATSVAPFLDAVERGDLDGVRRGVAQHGATARGPKETTPLHVAARHGRVDVVALLVASGASVADRDETGATALHVACSVKDATTDELAIVKLLLAHGAVASATDNAGTSPVDLAIARGRVSVVRELVARGASLTAVGSDRRTVLHRAVINGDAAMVTYLLSPTHEPKIPINAVDAAGWTALHLAVRARSVEIVTTLLAHNADVNVQTTGRRGEPATRYEASALHLAIRSDDTQLLTLLLDTNGIDLNLRNDAGRTPLVYAVSLDRDAAASLLIQAGADVNIRGDAGESALLVATYRGCDASAHALLRCGARTDVTARSGRSLLTMAKTPELREVIELYHTSQQYHDQCFALLSRHTDAPPTIETLLALVPLITSVYDLRHMLTLVAMCESSPAERRKLLYAAFLHVVDHKLTFDDAACVFFKLSLERCERDKLLPREDFLLLDRKAEKVNTESAEWVMEMKKQVNTNSWRLDAHDQQLLAVTNGLHEVHASVMANRKVLLQVTKRVGGLERQVKEGKKLVTQLWNRVGQASNEMRRLESRLSQSEEHIAHVATNLRSFKESYVDRLQQEERNKKIKRVCGVVAAVAGFVLAPVLKEVADAIVDFISPIDLVEKLYGEHDIAGFLCDKSTHVLPQAIQDQLEKFAIPQDEFEALLREEIVLQHPEYIDECEKRGLTVSVDGGRSDTARTLEPTLDQEEATVLKIVDELRALCIAAPAMASGVDVDVERSSGNPRPASLTNLTTTPAVPIIPPIVPVTTIHTHRETLAWATQRSEPQATEAIRSPTHRDDTSHVSTERFHEPTASRGSAPTTPTAAATPTTTPTEATEATAATDGGDGVVEFVDDLDAYDYHAAVHESHGDLGSFQELLSMIDVDTQDPTAKMNMAIRTVRTTRESICAAEYAYRRGYDAVGDLLVSLMPQAPQAFDKTPASAVSLVDDPEDFPSFYAVDESEGDVDECRHLVLSLAELAADASLDQTIQADVERTTTEAVAWSAVEYACHLGYEEIVKCMLRELYKGSIPMRTKLQLLKAVRERAARNVAPAS